MKPDADLTLPAEITFRANTIWNSCMRLYGSSKAKWPAEDRERHDRLLAAREAAEKRIFGW